MPAAAKDVKSKKDSKSVIDANTLELFNRLREIGTINEIDPQSAKQDPDTPIYPIDGKIREELKKRGNRADEIRSWIREEAEKNRQYYLRRAQETGKPWMHNPKNPMIYSEYIALDNEMADVVLAHNPRNRNIKVHTLESYMRDISADIWIETDEAIGIDTNGNLYNGQHRTTAVSKTGKTTIFYFTFNVLPEAKAVVDSGIRRSTTEKMQMMLPTSDLKVGTKLSAVSRSMMRGSTNSGVKWSDSEIARFATRHHDVIVWAVRNMPKCRADVQGAIAKAYLWYGEDVVTSFCKRFANLEFINDEDFVDPMKTLYKFLQKSKEGGHRGTELYRKTLAAIHACVNNKSLKALYAREEDLFEWVGTWEVPSK